MSGSYFLLTWHLSLHRLQASVFCSIESAVSFIFTDLKKIWRFPGGAVVKNSLVNAGDTGDAGSIPVPGRSSGEGNGSSLQYSCLENPTDRGVPAVLHPKISTGLKNGLKDCLLALFSQCDLITVTR